MATHNNLYGYRLSPDGVRVRIQKYHVEEKAEAQIAVEQETCEQSPYLHRQRRELNVDVHNTAIYNVHVHTQ